jgi:hypothetical protein
MKKNEILGIKNMQRVDAQFETPLMPLEQWSWQPNIANANNLKEIVASGSSTTTRNTYSTQQDHGESY